MYAEDGQHVRQRQVGSQGVFDTARQLGD